MLTQQKMGLVVASVTVLLTVMVFAPYLIPVTVVSDGIPENEVNVATTPTPAGMIAYWELNENGGTNVHDSIGPYLNGYTHGDPRWVPGIAQSGLEILTNQYIDFGSPSALYAINTLTIEAWVNLPVTTGLHTILMNSYSSIYTMYHFAINDGHLYFDRQSTTPGSYVTSTMTISPGEWHHVAIVMDTASQNHNVRFYVDGAEEIIGGYNDPFSGPNGLVTIGANRPSGASSYLNGMIDEVAMYNIVVDRSLINEHYQKGLLGLGYLDDLPTNTAPVANDDSYTMDQDTVLSISPPGVLGNDQDVDGDPLQTSLVSSTSSGGLALHPDGGFTYTPATGFVGVDSFSYQAYDGTYYSTPATCRITVEAVNYPPVGVDDSYSIYEDSQLAIAAPGVLVNDHDPNPSDTLTARVITGPQHGSLTFFTSGQFVYTPFADYNGLDSFTYHPFDGTVYGNTATVTLTVVGVNDPPVAVDDHFVTDEDTTLNMLISAILANDSDLEGSSLTLQIESVPQHGSFVIAADELTYTPDPNWYGEDSFTYRAFDGTAFGNLATVTITVNPINDPPVASDDAYTGTEDGTITALTLLDNDSDVEGDSLQVILVDGPSWGLLDLDPFTGEFTYTPPHDWFGTDSFTYKLYDGQDYSNIATVELAIASVNDPPVARDDSFVMDEDSILTMYISGILANDYDADGDVLTLQIESVPTLGEFTILPDSFVYTPVPDWSGTVFFTYRVFDGTAFGNLATVTIIVNPVNDAPVASDVSYYADESTSLTIPYAEGILLSGVTDIDTATELLTVTLVEGPAVGTLVLNSDGSFDYSVTGYHGTVTFTYQAFDGAEYSNIATVTIYDIGDDDTTGPEITIIYTGDATDGSPGTWTVSVVDPESGIDWITVEIDGILVGSMAGLYAVPNLLGPHTIVVEAANADLDTGIGDQETSTASHSVTIVDDDTTGPEISITYSGDYTDGNPGTWTVSVVDPESGIDSLTVEIDGILVGSNTGLYAVPSALGLHTIVVTTANADLDTGAVDQETSSLSNSVTIVDDDTTAPIISITYTGEMTDTNPGYWTIVVSDVESGVSSIIVEIDGTLVGSSEGDYVVPGTLGPHTITVTAVNADQDRPYDQETNTSTDTVEIEEGTLATTITYTGDLSGVYSDPIYLEAVLLATDDQSPIPGKTVLFTLGTQSAYAVTDTEGVASVYLVLDQPADTYKLTVSFTGDDDYLESSSVTEFIINRECASTIYTGRTIIEVSDESIVLSVTVFDDVDGYWGDLSNVYVTFTLYLASDPLTPIFSTSPVRVQLTSHVGIGLTSIEIPNLEEGEYLVVASLLPEHNRYYCAPDTQGVNLSIYEPNRAFVKGVGVIKDAEGHNVYFAFRVEYKCRGRLSGYLVLSYIDGDWVNFMSSCRIYGFTTDGNHGYFEANGTITRFNFRTHERICSREQYRYRVDVFDNYKSHEKDIFQIRIFDNLGAVEYEAGYEPMGHLRCGCIKVKTFKRH